MDLTALALDDLTEWGREARAKVLQYTGIPVSIGIAPTKTLSKIATESVKRDSSYAGVLDLARLTEAERDVFLAAVPVEDVWGIGRKYALFLNNYGIATAKDLKVGCP